MLVILVTQEAKIRRIILVIIFLETLSKKKKPSQKRAGRVAQVVDPEFKPQYLKKIKVTINEIYIFLSSVSLIHYVFVFIVLGIVYVQRSQPTVRQGGMGI
jgi:hypothetical protein